MKILQYTTDPEEKLPSVGPDGVEVGCDDVSCHKREFDDATFDHTPNCSKVEGMIFFCAFKVRA